MPLTLQESAPNWDGNHAITSRKAWLKQSPGTYRIKIGVKQSVKKLVMTVEDLASIKKRIDLNDPVGSIEAKFTNGEGISSKKCSENLSIKFRKGGEKIHLNGSHHSKTLKNFLNERKVLPWVRDKIPLIFDNQELICVGDLWTNQNFIADSSERSFLIQWNTEMKIL